MHTGAQGPAGSNGLDGATGATDATCDTAATGSPGTTLMSGLTDMNISNPTNNQGIIYNSTSSKFENKTIDHTTLSNIGSNSHSQIDTFISSKSQNSGLASVDIIYHKKLPFEKIFILHNDNSTKEYQNIDAEYLEELPDTEEINLDVKQLIIIKDIDIKIFLGNKEVY